MKKIAAFVLIICLIATPALACGPGGSSGGGGTAGGHSAGGGGVSPAPAPAPAPSAAPGGVSSGVNGGTTVEYGDGDEYTVRALKTFPKCETFGDWLAGRCN